MIVWTGGPACCASPAVPARTRATRARKVNRCTGTSNVVGGNSAGWLLGHLCAAVIIPDQRRRPFAEDRCSDEPRRAKREARGEPGTVRQGFVPSGTSEARAAKPRGLGEPTNERSEIGGEAGIRTLGTTLRSYNGLANRRL